MTGGFAESRDVPNTNIIISSYDIASKIKPILDKRAPFDLLICDESHYIKSESAKRTQAILGTTSSGKKLGALPIDARMRLFMTGTPILNRPYELWPILRLIDPEGLGANHWRFAKTFCSAWESPWGWDFSGASNLDRLQEELRQRVMIRRLKEDVLPDLPQKQRQIIPIPIDEVRAIVEAERSFYEQNTSTIEEARKIAIAAKEANDPLTYEAAASVMKSSKKAIFEEMARLRHATAVAKIPYAISYIEDAFQQQDKVFIIAHHRDVIDAICNKFGDRVVRFDGSVSLTDRQKAIDRFINDKSVKGFVGGITVAGIGIDGLQKVCSYGLVVEILWTPALLDQMEDRLVRIGQTKSCLFQYLLFDSSIDVSMLKSNFNKDEIIDKAVG